MSYITRMMFVIVGLTMAISICIEVNLGALRAAQTSVKTHYAPDFTLKDTNGKTVRLTKLKGKVVLLDFWATWCPPCRASLPHTQEISKSPEAKSGKLVVLGINVGESAKTVKSFMHAHGYTFRTLLDESGKTLDKYHSEYIPTFVIIDRKGKIAWQQSYFDEEALNSALKKALKE